MLLRILYYWESWGNIEGVIMVITDFSILISFFLGLKIILRQDFMDVLRVGIRSGESHEIKIICSGITFLRCAEIWDLRKEVIVTINNNNYKLIVTLTGWSVKSI